MPCIAHSLLKLQTVGKQDSFHSGKAGHEVLRGECPSHCQAYGAAGMCFLWAP